MKRLLIAGAAMAALFGGTAHAAQGLNGAYYVFNTAPGTLAGAEADIAAAPGPTATFIGTEVCYPNCDGTFNDLFSLSQFLGANAHDLSTDQVTNLGQHVMVLTGFLSIPTTGLYSFTLESDDGSQLAIDGSPLLSRDGDIQITTTTPPATLDLTAGLHAIRILQFEDFGSSGLTVRVNGDPLAGALIQNDGVPEPASWALMIAGFGGLGAMLRRRRGAFSPAS